MDDKTAYEILKLRPGTRKDIVLKRFYSFTKLYKLYKMGEKVYLSSDEIEKMRDAYIFLCYEHIKDEDLLNLYPQENTGFIYQTYYKTVVPFIQRHRAKIVYTIIMCIITYIANYLINYRPVDIKILIYGQPAASYYDEALRTVMVAKLEKELKERNTGIENPRMDFKQIAFSEDMKLLDIGFSLKHGVDVYIMEESFYKALVNKGIDLYDVDCQSQKGVYISTETTLYKYVCNWYADNKDWVAVISRESPRKDKAERFVQLIQKNDAEMITSTRPGKQSKPEIQDQ